MGMSDPESYYCTECKHSHKYSSKIGKAHLDYADVEPAEITVKPAADSNKTVAEAHVSQPPGDTVKPQPKGEKVVMHPDSNEGTPVLMSKDQSPGSGGPTEQEIERWITEDPKFATLMAVNLELSNKLKEVIDHQSRAQYTQPQHTAPDPPNPVLQQAGGLLERLIEGGALEKAIGGLLGGEKKEDETTSLVRMVVDEINLREETSKRERARAIAGYITGDYEIDVKVPEDKK